MNAIETTLDDDDDEDSEDPLDYPGYARARIVSVKQDGRTIWGVVAFIDEPPGGEMEVPEKELRIIDQYEGARRRQADAQALAERRWIKPAAAKAPPPEKLTPRQEEFCRRYAAQPVATRAAALAGFAESNAANQGSRLLSNPQVLDRIAQLRAEQKLQYVIEVDTLHDKLEAIFFEALSDRNHAAAVSALRLQAGIARLPMRASPQQGESGAAESAPKPKRPATRRKAEKSLVRTRKKPRKA